MSAITPLFQSAALSLPEGTLTRSQLQYFKAALAEARSAGMGLLKVAYIDQNQWAVRFDFLEGHANPVTLTAEDTHPGNSRFKQKKFESIRSFQDWVAGVGSYVTLPAPVPEFTPAALGRGPDGSGQLTVVDAR